MARNFSLELKDTSEAEMQKFDRFMLQILNQVYEEKKAARELDRYAREMYRKKNTYVEETFQSVKHTPVYKIKIIEDRGFIIAPNGIRLHKTPIPHDPTYLSKKGIAATVYKPSTHQPVRVLYEDLDNAGWYKIRTYDNKEGYIEKQHISILKYNKLLDGFTHAYHYVKPGENFENNIAKTYLNNIPLKTGFDRRNLAQSFFLLNSQSGHNHGITMNDKNISTGDFLELAYKAQYDPTFNQARLNYKTLQLKEGHIVRVPNYNYIQLQRKLNTLSSRPDFMNHTIDAGRVAKEILAGMAGVIAGIIEGLFMGIYDMLVGIIDSIKQIIETIYDLFTGVLFEKLKNMFLSIIETIKKMTPEEIKKAFIGMLGKAGEHIMATINNWVKASSFEKGKVIGLVLGNLLLEVLLAIFTGGSANMAKWASKLGKLGKVLLKVAEFADDIKDKLKKKLPKKYFEKGVYDKDPDDTKNWMRAALFVEGKAITETMDARGNTVKELMFALNKSNIYPKLKPKWDATFKKKNVYAITLTASPTKTVDAHFTSGEKDGKNNREQTDLTKEEIDKLQKIDGQYPINSLEFAGRTFDFNLDKNPRMKKIMEKRWKERKLSDAEIELEKEKFKILLDKYPKGVKFTEKGFPDFNPYVEKFKGEKIQVKLDNLNPGKNGSDKDIREAIKKFKLTNPDWKMPKKGFTWHHIENTTELQLVPFDLHRMVRHHGGRSTM